MQVFLGFESSNPKVTDPAPNSITIFPPTQNCSLEMKTPDEMGQAYTMSWK